MWLMKNDLLKKIILISLMIFAAFTVWAESGSKEPNVLVQAHYAHSAGDRIKPEIYNEVTAEYLNLHGLNAVIIDNDSEINELLSTATWFGAFFLVEIIIIEDAEEDTLLFKAYSTWDSQTIKETEASIPITASGIVEPVEAMEELVEVIRQYLQ
ncbi:MAG TPA: hypothetical protein DCO79_16800, partial [Spirochaeta sp.]|nr:hypothetical protein [Spirochaeta sp.]